MPYNPRVYKKAKQLLAERRQNAENELERRHAQVIKRCPEILELENRMARQGADIVRAIGLGEDAQPFIDKLARDNLLVQQQRRAAILAAGFDENYLSVKYTCPKCRDTGTHDTFYCECYKKLVRELAFEELAKSSPLSLSTFDAFRLDYYPETSSVDGVSVREHMRRVLGFCRDYAEDFSTASPSILMYGQTGLGKTHLSLAIAASAVTRGFAVVYDSTQNIMNKLQREHFGRADREDDTALLLEECDLLILDDLGAEFSTQFTVAALYNILNTRILKGLPVIISTNLNMKELEEKYSLRIASRIIGNFVPLFFCGKDIRQIKA